jgi:hypothetical protein
MARQTLDPLEEGGHITAAKINDAFGASGATGLVSNVSGDQVAQGGITGRACNTGVRIGASAASRGNGNPWFGGEALAGSGVNNLTLVAPGDIITGNSYVFIQSGANDMQIDLSDEIADSENGDFALIEFSGQAHFFHYLAGTSPTDAANTVPGAAPSYTSQEADMKLVVTLGGSTVDVPHATIPGNDAHFGTLLINGNYTTTYGSGNICPTTPNVSPYGTEDDMHNTGSGTFRSFHLSCIVPLDGTQSALTAKVAVRPGQSIGGSPAPFASPIAHILQANFTARVIRKGNK